MVLVPRRWHQVRETLHERLASNGGKKARSPGRARINRNTIAQGRPDDSAYTCGSFPVLFLCTGAAGAAGTRPSLRPLFPEGQNFQQSSDAMAPRERYGASRDVIASDLSADLSAEAQRAKAEAQRAKAEAKQSRISTREAVWIASSLARLGRNRWSGGVRRPPRLAGVGR